MRPLLLSLLFVAGNLFAQSATGIQFEHKSFDELLAQAKSEEKIIFLDAYTTWCGPCKMMSAKVFPQEKVGAVFNERFVNAKIDMEKGEGPQLSADYSVMAYPTYLFINGDGQLVHKAVGYIPADRLLEIADVAVSDQNLLTMNSRYEGGERSEEFVSAYLATLTDVFEQDRAASVADTYLATKEDWSSPEVMDIILEYPGEYGEKRFNYLTNNFEAFANVSSSAQLIYTINSVLLREYAKRKGVSPRTMHRPEDLGAFYSEVIPSLNERLSLYYEMIYAGRKDYGAYPKAAVKYLTAYPSNDAGELNSVAWNFFEDVEDKEMLKKALDWARKSVELDKGYPNMDTLAWLYHKLGMKEEAKKTAMEAIELAKATGQDFSDTSPILED